MKALPLMLALGAGIAAFAAASPAKAKAAADTTYGEQLTPQQVYELGQELAQAVHWPGLPTFFVANAYTESRFHPDACAHPCGENSERGLFQLRPRSLLEGTELAYLADQPERLYNARLNGALNAWLLHRLQKYAAPGQVINWLALRRGQAYPRLVDDVDELEERSAEVRQRFATALEKNGRDPSFMFEPAFPSGYEWPGIEAVLEAVRAPVGALVGASTRRVAGASRQVATNSRGLPVFAVVTKTTPARRRPSSSARIRVC